MRMPICSTWLAREFEGEQFHSRFVAIGRSADDADEFIEIGQRDEITFERFGALLGFAQFEARSAQNDFAAMIDVSWICLLERQQFRPAVIDREHVDRERAFHRGVLVKIVDHDLRVCVALQLDHYPRVFVRFVTNRSDVGQHFFVHQRRDALDQRGAVHVVRNFGDDDLLAVALEFFDAGLAAHFHAAASGLEILSDARQTADGAAGRKIRPLHVLHQPIDRDLRIVDLGTDAIDDFAQIVRRHICCHADGDAGAAIDQKIRKCRRKNRRLGPGLVVVRDEIDRVLVHVGHERRTEMRHARLGVTHGCRWIAFDRTEISLTVDERFAHRPCLRHMHECWINHGLAVWVIVTARVTANLRALPVLPVREKRQIVHRVEDATLRRLQPVPRVWQRARNNDRHRVIEERPRHFIGDVNQFYFFVLVIHKIYGLISLIQRNC